MGGKLQSHWLALIGALTAWAAGGRMVLAAGGACAWLDCLHPAWTFCPIYKYPLVILNMSPEEHGLGLRWTEIGSLGRNLKGWWFV